MERFTCELVYDRSAPACHDARYFDACRPELKIGLEFDRQKQRFERFRACGRKDGKKIAQRSASFTRDDLFERGPLGLIRPLIDDDLTLTISVLDFTRPLVMCRSEERSVGQGGVSTGRS